jgi:hypothetical protein
MMDAISDDELVRRFEDGSLPGAEFHHAEHVRLTWTYLKRHGREEALRRLNEGLVRFATRNGHPEKFDYELTRRWVHTIDRARIDHPDARTFEALVRRRPDLLDRSTVRVEC